MNGKNKCKLLKEIRKQIAAQNDIEYVTSECKYKGDCSGTCPKCESEVRYLEEQLRLRQKAGKAVAVAGIAAALMVTSTGCDLPGTDKPSAGASISSSSYMEIVDGGLPLPEDTVAMGRVPADTTAEEGTFVLGEVPYDFEAGDVIYGGISYVPRETVEELMGDIAYVPEDTTEPELMGEPTEPEEMVIKGMIAAPTEE